MGKFFQLFHLEYLLLYSLFLKLLLVLIIFPFFLRFDHWVSAFLLFFKEQAFDFDDVFYCFLIFTVFNFSSTLWFLGFTLFLLLLFLVYYLVNSCCIFIHFCFIYFCEPHFPLRIFICIVIIVFCYIFTILF